MTPAWEELELDLELLEVRVVYSRCSDPDCESCRRNAVSVWLAHRGDDGWLWIGGAECRAAAKGAITEALDALGQEYFAKLALLLHIPWALVLDDPQGTAARVDAILRSTPPSIQATIGSMSIDEIRAVTVEVDEILDADAVILIDPPSMSNPEMN